MLCARRISRGVFFGRQRRFLVAKAVLNYQQEPKKALGRYIGQEDKGDVEDIVEEREIDILNGRELNAEFARNGFEMRDWPTKVEDFADKKAIETIYYDEMSELVKAASGASLVIPFDYTIRETGNTNLNVLQNDASAAPVQRVHSDYTEASAPRRLEQLLRQKTLAEYHVSSLRNSDYAFINVWRSIDPVHPVKKRPLALLDRSSVNHARDAMRYELRFPERCGETYSLRYHKEHSWCYFPQMNRDECLIFSNYDSRRQYAGVFHTAFNDPETEFEEGPPRTSIEIRTIAFFPRLEQEHTSYTFYDMAHSNNAARIRLWLELDDWNKKHTIIQSKMIEYPHLKSLAFKSINPLRKVPALLKPNGDTVFESSVILSYLEDKFGHFQRFTPKTADERQKMELMIRCHDLYIASPNNTQPGFSHTQGAMYLSAAFHGPDRAMSIHDRAAKLKELWSQLVWLDNFLVGKPYLAGNALSLADLTWFPTCVFMEFMLPRIFDWPQLFDHPAPHKQHHSPLPRLAKWFHLLSFVDQHDARSHAPFRRTRDTILSYWQKMDAEPHRQFAPILTEIAENPQLKWKYP